MKRSFEETGITLVALVVTIVVLLILAGITITYVFGDNGIIKLAQKAKNETETAAQKEQDELRNLLNIQKGEEGGENEKPGEEFDPSKPKAEGISLNAKFCVVTGGDSWTNDFKLKPTITPEDANQIVAWKSSDESIATVDNDGNVKATANGKGGDIEIIATTKDGTDLSVKCEVRVEMFGAINDANTVYTDSSSQETYKEVTIPKDYAVATSDNINKIDGGLVIQDNNGNQFVWVPVNETAFSKMINETNHTGNSYNFLNSGTSKIEYDASGYREPDSLTTYDDTSSYFTDAGIAGVMNAETFKTRLQSDFNSMEASVKKYHGFFIGRYETGNLEENSTNVPVVQRGNKKIGNVNWYYIYAQGQRIAKNDKVISSMIWGCQWDRTTEWIVTRNGGNYALATNSIEWGNYKDTTFEYLDTDGITKKKSTNEMIPTGSTERNKQNNIYDMAGNVFDWTIEANNTYNRVRRRRRLWLFWGRIPDWWS